MTTNNNNNSFFQELKRRNIYRVGVAYAVVTWLLLQIMDTVAPIIALPEWAPKLVLTLMIIGFPVAMLFAWAYELTPEGLKREDVFDPFRNEPAFTALIEKRRVSATEQQQLLQATNDAR
ncbi:MAG: hypothetical protein OEW64_12870 [Gammaproteobacteria bacterium]|nr:hypothetical protein [Gammaproteobacteria bacterium]MDH5304975.1 hypothetical protein [Gammaproteobacteria bacterium]MDH5321999.1 hypothetical protein [Gammaproteobacteria bacterium]